MIKLHDKHPKGYVPLWKQWMKTEDYKHFLKHELPILVKKAAAIDGLTQKQREELMAKEFQLRWVNAQTGKVEESKHNSEKSAKDKARDLSMTNSPVQVGEVDGGKLLQQWNYEKGRQQVMDAKKQVSVAPISKKEAASIKTNDTLKGTTTMATKTSKNNKAPAKASKAPAKAAAAPKKLTGTVRDQFGLREGSNKEKIVDALLAAKGKFLTISQLLKAAYGSAKEDNKGALNMAINGIVATIAKNKIKLNLVKEKNDNKEMTIALKTK